MESGQGGWVSWWGTEGTGGAWHTRQVGWGLLLARALGLDLRVPVSCPLHSALGALAWQGFRRILTL